MALLLLAAGCAPAPGRLSFDTDSPGGPRVVVAPVNLAVPLDWDLEEAADPVSWQIVHHLRGGGSGVAVLHRVDAEALWQDTLAALRTAEEVPPDLGATAGAFAATLGLLVDFDLLVLPSLVYRPARVNGRYARWDGVRRRLSLFWPPEEGVAFSSWRGEISGLSLHVLVYERDGRHVAEGWGGIDLVHDAVFRRGLEFASHFLRLQPELIENPEHVREGVAIALDRWPNADLP